MSGTITIPEVAHDTDPDEYVVRPLHPLDKCFYDQVEMLTHCE